MNVKMVQKITTIPEAVIEISGINIVGSVWKSVSHCVWEGAIGFCLYYMLKLVKALINESRVPQIMKQLYIGDLIRCIAEIEYLHITLSILQGRLSKGGRRGTCPPNFHNHSWP